MRLWKSNPTIHSAGDGVSSTTSRSVQLKRSLAALPWEQQVQMLQPRAPFPNPLAPQTVQLQATTSGEPLTETDAQVGEQLAKDLEIFKQGNEYPKNAKYPPPTSVSQMTARLQGYGIDKGALTEEERDWLYKAASLCGLFEVLGEFADANEAGKPLEPGRLAIVGYALSQVGLVEAERGVTDPNDPNGPKVRKGYEHLKQYHDAAGKNYSMSALKDPNIKVGPSGGNQFPSWCQTFAQWAVEKGNGTFSLNNPTKDPKPGDFAYMAKAQHMAVIVSVENGLVTTVDGNMPSTSIIVLKQRQKSEWDQGFHNTFP